MRLAVVTTALLLALTGCSGGTSGTGAGAPPAASRSISGGVTAAGAVAAPATAAPCGWKTASRYRHVIWIWMENRTYAQVLGSGAGAPRLSSYASRCGLATRYLAVTHPSLPNYLAATSGSTGGVTSDCGPTQCPQARASLFGQVQQAGRQWRGYAEGMPQRCALADSGRYAPRHNPAVYFTPVRSRCRTWDVPMGGTSGAFATALAQARLPAFSFVTPDLCHDGHDCNTSTADSWLGSWLDRISRSTAYRKGDTAVFVTWDEGVGATQRIATVVVAPTVVRGTRSAAAFTHYSLLRTTEELLGLPALGAARGARSMRGAFRL